MNLSSSKLSVFPPFQRRILGYTEGYYLDDDDDAAKLHSGIKHLKGAFLRALSSINFPHIYFGIAGRSMQTFHVML